MNHKNQYRNIGANLRVHDKGDAELLALWDAWKQHTRPVDVLRNMIRFYAAHLAGETYPLLKDKGIKLQEEVDGVVIDDNAARFMGL